MANFGMGLSTRSGPYLPSQNRRTLSTRSHRSDPTGNRQGGKPHSLTGIGACRERLSSRRCAAMLLGKLQEESDAERTFDRRRGCQPRQGRHHRDFHDRSGRRFIRNSGHRRFLGAVVRPVQTARPDPRKDGPRRQRRGAHGQAQHRRKPGDRAADAHPVDPGGLCLQGRQAGRRLCRRAAGEPSQAVRPADQRRQGRRPLAGRGSDGDGEGGFGRRATTPAPQGSIRRSCSASRPMSRRRPASPGR